MLCKVCHVITNLVSGLGINLSKAIDGLVELWLDRWQMMKMLLCHSVLVNVKLDHFIDSFDDVLENAGREQLSDSFEWLADRVLHHLAKWLRCFQAGFKQNCHLNVRFNCLPMIISRCDARNFQKLVNRTKVLKIFFESLGDVFVLNQNFDLFLTKSDEVDVATWFENVCSQMPLTDFRFTSVEDSKQWEFLGGIAAQWVKKFKASWRLRVDQHSTLSGLIFDTQAILGKCHHVDGLKICQESWCRWQAIILSSNDLRNICRLTTAKVWNHFKSELIIEVASLDRNQADVTEGFFDMFNELGKWQCLKNRVRKKNLDGIQDLNFTQSIRVLKIVAYLTNNEDRRVYIQSSYADFTSGMPTTFTECQNNLGSSWIRGYGRRVAKRVFVDFASKL